MIKLINLLIEYTFKVSRDSVYEWKGPRISGNNIVYNFTVDETGTAVHQGLEYSKYF